MNPREKFFKHAVYKGVKILSIEVNAVDEWLTTLNAVLREELGHFDLISIELDHFDLMPVEKTDAYSLLFNSGVKKKHFTSHL